MSTIFGSFTLLPATNPTIKCFNNSQCGRFLKVGLTDFETKTTQGVAMISITRHCVSIPLVTSQMAMSTVTYNNPLMKGTITYDGTMMVLVQIYSESKS